MLSVFFIEHRKKEILSYFKSFSVITKVDYKMRPEDGACIAYITFEVSFSGTLLCRTLMILVSEKSSRHWFS